MRCRLLVVVVASLLAAGCSSSGSSKTAARPTSHAHLVIANPTPNEVTGPNVTIRLVLTGATVVPASTVKGQLLGDRGHIHVTVDSRIVSMAYGTTQDLPPLAPGTHTMSAEFVAVDHLPFANRVLAPPVIFQVK